MLNIKTIKNGFQLNNLIYLFDGNAEVISESQCHIPTNNGIILLDLSCAINEVEFLDINEFIKALNIE
jgi:hypothetical protein